MQRSLFGLGGAWLLAAACAAGEGAWTDCLARHGADWAAGGKTRIEGGALVARAEPGAEWTVVDLAEGGPAYDLEVELRWAGLNRQQEGEVSLAVGPHWFGTSGYRIAAGQEPLRVVECRGPRLPPDTWHPISLSVRPGSVEYRLSGETIARCPVDGPEGGPVRLMVRPATTATVRACRVRRLAGGDVQEDGTLFRYPAAAFPHVGRVDKGAAIAVVGRGRNACVVGRQDGSLPASGPYEARFRLRGGEGSGAVWLWVSRSGEAPVAARSLRLEELPASAWRDVAVPFAYEAGWLMEYRLAAETGRLLVEGVTVVPRAAGQAGPGPKGQRFRRARALADVWGKASQDPEAALRIVRLSRTLEGNGDYTFRVLWQADGTERLSDVGLDIWVATRGEWGRVRVFDYGVAYDGVEPGRHDTAAQLDPESIRRYGAPVAFLAQIYWRGKPLAASWRKWSVPVDDKYIVPAERVGPLHEKGEAKPPEGLEPSGG